MPHSFFSWFEEDSPNFTGFYGAIQNFYDKENDTFMIEEIQTAYEQFKNGDEPDSLYYTWSHVQ